MLSVSFGVEMANGSDLIASTVMHYVNSSNSNLIFPSMLGLDGGSSIKAKSTSGRPIYVELPKLVHANSTDIDGDIRGYVCFPPTWPKYLINN